MSSETLKRLLAGRLPKTAVFAIPAMAGTRKGIGHPIGSGMTGAAFFIAGLIIAGLMASPAPARASAGSVYAVEVISAEADGGNAVVEVSMRYPTYGQSQPDNGIHALGPPDFYLPEEGSGASGWITWSGTMVLRFDYFLQDGEGDDLSVQSL